MRPAAFLPGPRRLPALMALAATLVPQPALADLDSSGQPLVCIGTDTFYPRGDRWAEAPGGTVTVQFQPDGPSNQTGNYAMAGDIANEAVFDAFNVWANVTCADNLNPDIRFALGSYPTRDTGYNSATGTYQTVVYFAVESDQWPADSLTVADTANHYYEVTLTDQAADVIFNNLNYNFRTTNASNAAYGCNVADGNCYDIESVSLHEVGHFLGFNHVACSDAIMYPSGDGNAATTTLSHHEQGGVCALYPPRTYAGTASTMGESCASSSDCLNSLSCLKPPNSAADTVDGWCAESCSNTNNCPVGWVCGSQGASSPVCVPGIHLGGVPVVATVASNADLCAPCTVGSQCDSDVCGIDPSDGNGICVQQCSAPDYACPDDFACVNSDNGLFICWPNAEDTCTNLWQGAPINGLCLDPSTVSGAATDLTRDCASGGQCFTFAASGVGDCLVACSTTVAGEGCATGFTCCVDLDSNGNCITSESGVADGGCFKLSQPGELCITPDQSVCVSGSICTTNSASNNSAECYRTCAGDGSNDGCALGEECVTTQSTPICCDASRYDGTDFDTCWPVPAACTREIGVTCSTDADCTSNYCLKGATGSACSATCTTDDDCPGAGVDVNGDGVPDAGTSCESIGTQDVCVPTGAIAAAPACAGATSGSSGGGCSCSATQDFGWTWAVVALLWASGRARRYLVA